MTYDAPRSTHINYLDNNCLIFKDISNHPDLHDESTTIGKKYKKAKEIVKDHYIIEFREEDELE